MSILFRIQTYYPCKRLICVRLQLKLLAVSAVQISCHLEALELLETTFVFVDFPCMIWFEVLASKGMLFTSPYFCIEFSLALS